MAADWDEGPIVAIILARRAIFMMRNKELKQPIR